MNELSAALSLLRNACFACPEQRREDNRTCKSCPFLARALAALK